MSRTHPLREAFVLVMGLAAVAAAVVVVIARGVDAVVVLIPPASEARLFEGLAAGLESDRDRGEQRRLARGVLDRLAEHWPEAPYEFRVIVHESAQPNAAALPGGHVLVTTGLLDTVESENELAFVLGHELGHFHNRDHLRRLGRTAVYGLLLAVLRGSGEGLPALSSLAGELTARGFDRGQERDADRFGLELMQAEYGHVNASWRLFERLGRKEGGLGAAVAYFQTHPASVARARELQELARDKGWLLAGPLRPLGR